VALGVVAAARAFCTLRRGLVSSVGCHMPNRAQELE